MSAEVPEPVKRFFQLISDFDKRILKMPEPERTEYLANQLRKIAEFCRQVWRYPQYQNLMRSLLPSVVNREEFPLIIAILVNSAANPRLQYEFANLVATVLFNVQLDENDPRWQMRAEFGKEKGTKVPVEGEEES